MMKKDRIATGYYSIGDGCFIAVSTVVTKETDKCYYGEGKRFMKNSMGKASIKSPTQYTYIQVDALNATEAELRREIADWMRETAVNIEHGTKMAGG